MLRMAALQVRLVLQNPGRYVWWMTTYGTGRDGRAWLLVGGSASQSARDTTSGHMATEGKRAHYNTTVAQYQLQTQTFRRPSTSYVIILFI
jgi:hypothetical protein